MIKKLILIPVLAVCTVLIGCTVTPLPTATVTPVAVTTPVIQNGVQNDAVPGRFCTVGENVFCAVSDSIIRTDGKDSRLELVCDAPDMLYATEDYIVYRCVSHRVDFKPAEYEVRVSYFNGSTDTVASGDITYVTVREGTLWYTTGTDRLSASDLSGAAETVQEGILTNPYRYKDCLYMGINGSLCELDLSTRATAVLAEGTDPKNITADENGVFFSTEDNSSLMRYDRQTGAVTTSDINNDGLTLYGGEHYYVVNDGGFFLKKASDNSVFLSLGTLQNCSAPFFHNDGVYFFVSSDDYYGLLLFNPQTGQSQRISQDEG